jgi:hypothetical protein
MTQRYLLDSYCHATFGTDSIDGGVECQRKLGINQQTQEATTRLLVSQPLMDPTSALCPSSWKPGHNRTHSRIIYIDDSAQVEDLSKAWLSDSDALVGLGCINSILLSSGLE